MTKSNSASAAALIVLLLFVSVGVAEDPWRAVSAIPPSPDAEPAVTLDCPRSLSTGAPAHESNGSGSSAFLGRGVAPVSFNEPSQSVLPPPPDPPPTLHTANQPPDAAPPPTSGPMPPPPPPGDAPFNSGVVIDKPLQHSFWDKCKGYFNQGGERDSASGHCLFQSDHCFDYFASPVTNPFLFEDPRALTEIKPLFIYQGAPRGNPIFKGGNSEFFGLQARLAFTQRLSLTINELGFVSLNPTNPGADPTGQFSKNTGFAQIELGPKYTFLRSEAWKTVAAGGVIFQVPAGSPRVFQNTGTLGLVPYLTAAKNFGLPAGWGSMNLMGTTGYSFSVDRSRSEYFYLSTHLDYNIANTNRFFPFVELNYFHYTQGGKANVPGFGFEGLDLVNFGSNSLGGRDYLAIAPGLRFKLNEHIQAGAAVSFPLLQQKELTDYRLTFDLIFRY